MKLDITSQGKRRIIKIEGKLTAEHCARFEQQVDSVVSEGARDIAFDLESVPFMDSSGVEQILRTCKLMREKQGKVSALRPSRRVLEMLQLFRLDQVIPIEQE